MTGFTIGGVSPIGHLNKINIYIDNSLERFAALYAAAGHPNCVFKIDFLNLQKITEGLIKGNCRMRQPKLLDYLLLTLLALIWASAFFNIKIATYSFGPVTIAFLRVFLEQFQFYYFVISKRLK